MTIVRLMTDADFDEWHALRMRALREEPEAFWRSPHEEEDPAPLLERFRAGAVRGDAGIVVATLDGRMVGCVGVGRHMPHAKRHHVGGIWGVYVAPEARGRGLSQRMLEAAIEHARAIEGLELLELGVWVDNPAAVKVYERCGFRTWGTEPAAIKIDGKPLDEFMMTLRLLDE